MLHIVSMLTGKKKLKGLPFLNLKESQKEKGNRPIFHSLILSLKQPQWQGWASNWKFVILSSGKAAQVLGPSSVTFPGRLARKLIRNGVVGTDTNTHVRFLHCRWQLQLLCHNISLRKSRKGILLKCRTKTFLDKEKGEGVHHHQISLTKLQKASFTGRNKYINLKYSNTYTTASRPMRRCSGSLAIRELQTKPR